MREEICLHTFIYILSLFCQVWKQNKNRTTTKKMKKQFLCFFIATSTNQYYISLHILLSHRLLQNGFVIVCMKGTCWAIILGKKKHCLAWDIERDKKKNLLFYRKWTKFKKLYFSLEIELPSKCKTTGTKSCFEWVGCGCWDQCKHTGLGTLYI